jgi:hypothetical protein
MTRKEYGIAYCDLNCWRWSDFFGKKPNGFDELPNWVDDNDSNIPNKMDIISPLIEECRNKLKNWGMSYYWWKFELKRPWYEWALWYYLKIDLQRF